MQSPGHWFVFLFLEASWKALSKYLVDSLISLHLDVTALMFRDQPAELETGIWDLTMD